MLNPEANPGLHRSRVSLLKHLSHCDAVRVPIAFVSVRQLHAQLAAPIAHSYLMPLIRCRHCVPAPHVLHSYCCPVTCSLIESQHVKVRSSPEETARSATMTFDRISKHGSCRGREIASESRCLATTTRNWRTPCPRMLPAQTFGPRLPPPS